MKTPLVVSYATPEYSPQLERLRMSCDLFDLPYLLVQRESANNWLKNVGRKPMIIRDALRSHGVILWLDADAEILRDPRPLFDADFEFCCNSRGRRRNESPDVPGAYRTGTMAFDRSPELERMLDWWVESCDCRMDFTEEPWLYATHMKFPGVKRLELPVEYICVEGNKGFWFPEHPERYDAPPENAIIVHRRTQVLSRSRA